MVRRSSPHVAGGVKVVVSAATLLDVVSALSSSMAAAVASGEAELMAAAGVIASDDAMIR